MPTNKNVFIDDRELRRSVESKTSQYKSDINNMISQKYLPAAKIANPNLSEDKIIEQVLKSHQGEFNMAMSVIAQLDHEGVGNFVRAGKESTILSSHDSYKQNAKFSTPNGIESTYSSMQKDFFSAVHTLDPWSPKVQTGNQLIAKAVSMDKAFNYQFSRVKNNISLASLDNAYKNFNKSNKFMAYDLETLGGLQGTGYRVLDNITEFSFQTFDKTNGLKPVVDQTFENIIGLSKEDAAKYTAEMEQASRTGFNTNRLNVIATRFGKYGHMDTKMDKQGAGIWKVSQFAGEEAEGIKDIGTIKRGIQRLAEVGTEQRANKLPSGLMAWEDQMIKAVSLMNGGTMPVVGYNDIGADVPWLNQFMAKMSPQAKTAMSSALGMKGSNPFLSMNQDMHIDMRTLANAYGESVGKGTLYDSKEGKALLAKGFTPFQQEALARLTHPGSFLGNNKAAHTAGFDVEMLAKLAAVPGEGKSETLLDTLYNGAMKGQSAIKSKQIEFGKQLFVANQTYSFDDFSRKGALNFVHDNMSKTFRTFNGYEVGPNGAKKELFNQFGIRKDVAYTVDWMQELTMSDKWIEKMNGTDPQGLHPEYAQGKLFGIKLTPEFNKKIAGDHQGLQSPIHMFFNTKDEMEGFVSSGFAMVAEKDVNGNWGELADAAARKEVAEMFGTVSIDGANQTTSTAYGGAQNIIDRGSKKAINDTSARMIREDSYTKAINFDKFYQELSGMTGKKALKRTDVQNIVSEVLAKGVSSRKGISMNFDNIQSILGFQSGSSHKVFRETVDNYMTAFDYQASQRSIANTITKVIRESNPNMGKDEKQFKYSQILNAVKAEAVTRSGATTPGQVNKIMSNAGASTIYNKDKNFFEFKLDDFFKNEDSIETGMKLSTDKESNILRINLNPNKEYGLVTDLINRNYNKTSIVKGNKNLYGVHQLQRFIGAVKDSGQYEDMFKDFDPSEYKSADVLSERTIDRIKAYRQKDSSSGYINSLEIQDVTQEAAFAKHFTDMGDVEKIAKEVNANLPNYKVINNMTENGKELEGDVARMVDDILMPNRQEVFSSLDKYGYDDVQKRTIKTIYDTARTEQIEGITKFTKGLLQTDAKMMYDTQNKVLAIMLNGDHITLDNMPRIQFENGMLYTKTGSNKVALHAVLDAGNIKKTGKFDASQVSIKTTLGMAYKNTYNPFSSFKTAQDKGNVLNQARSWIAYLQGNVRVGEAIGPMDISDVHSQFRFDYKAVAEMLPALKRSGKLDGINWREDKDKSVFMDLVNKIEKYSDYTFDDKKSKHKVNSYDKQVMAKNMPYLLNIVGGNSPYGAPNQSSDLGFFTSNTTWLNKETQVTDWSGSVGGFTANAGQQFNNNARPVPTQVARAVAYRKKQWEDNIANSRYGLKGKVGVGGIFHNDFTKAMYNREMDGIQGETELAVRTNKVNMAQMEYQLMIAKDHAAKKAIHMDTEKSRKIYERLKGAQLFEQEKIMDARVMDAIFNNMEVQKISARKTVQLHLATSQKTLEKIAELGSIMPVITQKADGTFGVKLQKGKVVNRLDPILEIAGFNDNKQMFGAKSDGIFKFGYHSKGGDLLASESDIMDTINKNMGNLKNVSDVQRLLGEKYDASFYVKNVEQLSYKKIAHGMAEKDMAYAPYMGLGETDKDISSYLKKAGREKYIGKVLTEEDMALILDGKSDLVNKAYTERYGASVELFDNILGKYGIDAKVIANHNVAGHDNRFMAVEETTNSIVAKRMSGGMAEKDAVKATFDEMQTAGVFGIDGIKYADGKIMMPNALKGAEDHINIGALKEVAKGHGMLWNDGKQDRMGTAIKDPSTGRVIGTLTNGTMTEATDFQGMTADGYSDTNKIKNLMHLRDSAKDESTKAYYTSELEDSRLVQDKISRGMKITDREVGILGLRRYDDALMNTLHSGMSEDEIKEYAGHVLKKADDGSFMKDEAGQFVIDDKHKNRQVLSGYIDNIKRDLLAEPGDKLLKNELTFDADGNITSGEKYAHLKGFVTGNNAARNISVNKAEQIYSVGKTLQAQEWNSMKGTASLDQMKSRGFNLMGIDAVATTAGGDAEYILGHDNNILTKSSMIDLGEHIKNGKERYLALPGMPERVAADEYIKYDFQKQFNSLFKSKMDLDAAVTGDPNAKTYDKALASYRDSADNVKGLVDSLTGKYGIMAEASSLRIGPAVNGKTSSIATLSKSNVEKYIKDAGVRKDFSDVESVLKSEGMNFSGLSKAQFNGTSLLEHYDKGRNIDARFASEDAFRRLGMFEDSYMKSVGAKDESAMIEMLKTKGIMTGTVRYPSIKEGSIKPAMMYLDDNLQGNRTKLTAAGQIAAVGDNDGDLIASAITKYSSTDGKGKTVTEDSLQFMNNQKSSQFGDHWKDQQLYMMDRAVGVNKYWDSEVYSILNKDIGKAINNGDALTITASAKLDDKIYAEFGVAPTLDSVQKHLSTFGELENIVKERYKEPFKDHAAYLTALDETLDNGVDSALRDNYRSSAIFEEMFGRHETMMMSKARKTSIGDANVPLFKLRKMAELAISPESQFSGVQRNVIQQTSELIEQEVISAKKGSLRYNVDKIESFKTALNGMLYEGNNGEAKIQMKNWLTENISKESINSASELLVSKNEISQNMNSSQWIDTFVNSVGSFNTENLQALKHYDNYGSSLRGVSRFNTAQALSQIPGNENTMKNTMMSVLHDAGELSGSKLISDAEYVAKPSGMDMSKLHLVDGREWLDNESGNAGQEVKNILKLAGEGISNIAKGLDGKTLAIGALGLASAYILAGVAGGSPTAPSQMQAQQHAEEQYYTIPSLQDDSLAVAPSGQQQGYVVNINARTNKGQQHASSAIQTAIQNSMSTDVNVAMNINNNNGNISDVYLQKLLAGAM
jgi:hypothetical protein